MLHEQRVSVFPVLDDDNKVIGVVSESDLLTKEALRRRKMPGLIHGLGSAACATRRARSPRPT